MASIYSETDGSNGAIPAVDSIMALSPEEYAQAALDKLFGTVLSGQTTPPTSQDQLADHLNVTGGDLTFGEDIGSDHVSLEGLQEELEKFERQEVVASILDQGTELREFARDVEEKLRLVELESIQDYIAESDNLVALHDQIRLCDSTLLQMEALLGGFQADLGAISAEIKSLQDKSMGMGLKLKNRKAAESQLGAFVENMVLSPHLINTIVEGEVNGTYVKCLKQLNQKLAFVLEDPSARTSASIREVAPELERLRVQAVHKVRDFLINRLYALRKPKTNIQILQQNVLLKYRYLPEFLRERGKEVYPEVMSSYVDTMNKVLSLHFRTYILALERLQLDLATKNDLIGVDESRNATAGLFSRGRDLKNRSAVFALGDRINLLKDPEQSAIIPHIAEAAATKFPYEVLFRSLHKLLMDTATSEYLFCTEFFGDDAAFESIFSGPFAVLGEHLQAVLPTCHDAIGLMLMIRMTYQHQVNLLIWPRFKLVFDLHLASVKSASARSLWENDVHPHYVTRRYAEFAAAMMHLNTDYGDGQLDLNLDRLRIAVDNLLVDLSRLFPRPKQRTVFLINNYDLVLSVFKEEELREHFAKLINFVKTRAGSGEEGGVDKKALPLFRMEEVEPLVKDFAARWKGAIEVMHKDVMTCFSNFVCGMDILRAALTQLLLYYTRLSDSLKRVEMGAALAKDVVSIPAILYEIRKYSRTF